LCAGGNILPQITHNDIYSNVSHGIYLAANGVAKVNENNLDGNGTYGLYNDSGYAVDGRYNWWGRRPGWRWRPG